MKAVSKPPLTQLGLFEPGVIQKRLEEIGTQQSPLTHLAAIIEVFALFDAGRMPYYQRLKRDVLRESRRTLDKDQLTILRALNQGCQTRKEIAESTHLSESTVNSHLQKLLKRKLVIRRKTPSVPGKGGDQKSYLWWPAE